MWDKFSLCEPEPTSSDGSLCHNKLVSLSSAAEIFLLDGWESDEQRKADVWCGPFIIRGLHTSVNPEAWAAIQHPKFGSTEAEFYHQQPLGF